MRYALGLLVVAGLVAAVGLLLVGAAERRGVWLGIGLGLAVQAPLGWWVVRVTGSRRFLRAWGAGMLVRFLVVAVAALGLVRALRWQPEPLLLSLVAVLVMSVLVEAVALSGDQRRSPGT